MSAKLNEPLVFRLRERARIRRQIATRRSVIEGRPDRIADLLEEAAARITVMWWCLIINSLLLLLVSIRLLYRSMGG